MVPELGHYALILALFLSVALSVVPLAGVQRGNLVWMHSSRSLTAGIFFFTAIAFVCLSYAFWNDDFSVRYVATNSNSLLPNQYKLSAVWGGHEGSLLLWMLILSIWALAVSLFSNKLPLDIVARVLAVMGMLAVGFLLFLLLTSNPFDRYLPQFPDDGSDLNPLLQDPGLIFHPPMLYMGYVGFSVAFAFAIAALLSGRLDAAWSRWTRPWTNTAWAFLTLGIALGSWWAYYELGWGGWWFWDPVENASFMPWLVGTALIHSLAVTEKRGVFKSWTILLAIFAFSLSLLGTFLVRSGVLTSVHAFANDPARGVFILVFLALVIGGSLTLYALKAPGVKSRVGFSLLSRETLLLSGNILLAIVTATVLLGTLYPLVSDALNWGKISVGPPYFNFFFVPLMGLLCLVQAVGPLATWRRTDAGRLREILWIPLAISAVLGIVFPFFYGDEYFWTGGLTVFVGSWLVFSTLAELLHRVRHAPSLGVGLKKLSLSYYGMVVAHIGVAMVAMGVCLTSIYSEERDLRLAPGESVELGGYEYRFNGVTMVQGPNYKAGEGSIEIFRDGELYTHLKPQKRNYVSGGNAMAEAAIEPGFFRDLYVALGEPLDNGEKGAWAVRVHYKPFVRWIWLGALVMAFGGLLAIIDKRYRSRSRDIAGRGPN